MNLGSPTPFGWGANPNLENFARYRETIAASPMPFGWGANPNRLEFPLNNFIVTVSPMPFGWGANPNMRLRGKRLPTVAVVTNAFRLGG